MTEPVPSGTDIRLAVRTRRVASERVVASGLSTKVGLPAEMA
ncbi:hypothetical protein [Tessaracoccus sp. OS52]|nr:hypothetical protein [Tessaracoccus sp. OS52]